jgi:ribosomal-protein-alanine N-acetyltransferase
MSSQLEIREVDLSKDLAAMAKLCGQLGYDTKPDEILQRMKTVDVQRPTFVVTDERGEVVGWMSLRIEKSPEIDPKVEVSALVVDESMRGQGVGRLLMERAECWASERGMPHVIARSQTHRSDAHRFYQKMGYSISKTSHLFEKTVPIKDTSSSWFPKVLETDRLKLRPISLSDAPAIFEYARDPRVSQYTLWEPHDTIDDTVAFIKDYVFLRYRNQEPEALGIALKDNETSIIGTVGCFWVNRASSSMELAYALAKTHWGKGIAAEASNAVINYVFSDFPVIRVQARCKAENAASRRVMEKIGMQFEGTQRSSLKHRNRLWDVHYFSILNPTKRPA